MKSSKTNNKIINFIEKRPYLIWWVKNYERLNNEAVVEATLNYGDWEDVQLLFKILGIKTVAKIFQKQIKQKRINYRPKSKNYFSLYFKQHA
jgi:hypothetical protein